MSPPTDVVNQRAVYAVEEGTTALYKNTVLTFVIFQETKNV